MCALDEFSEYLLENRVPTSADFNTYPIRIFLYYRRCQFNYYMAKGRDSYSPEDLKSCNNCHKSAEKKRSEGNGMEVKK